MKLAVTGGMIIVLLVVGGVMNWTYRDVWGRGSSEVETQVPRLQHDARTTLPNSGNECGPMSLFLICEASGKSKSIAELRELTNTTENGTTMLDLKKAAASLGFRVEARQLPFGALRKHVSSPDGYAILDVGAAHFTSAFSASENTVRVADPVRGVRDMSETALRGAPYKWDGAALMITADENAGGAS
jgi:ABC-type bacteriocin/lantibiotic exporter with double-glycine peptidase domain